MPGSLSLTVPMNQMETSNNNRNYIVINEESWNFVT